jgi:hypothetical protein
MREIHVLFAVCVFLIPHCLWMIRTGRAALKTGVIPKGSHPYTFGRWPTQDVSISFIRATEQTTYGYVALGACVLIVILLSCVIVSG